MSSEQARLRLQVVEEDTEDWQRSPDFSGLERVGGVDLSFIKGDEVNACAQLVVLSYPDLEVRRPLVDVKKWELPPSDGELFKTKNRSCSGFNLSDNSAYDFNCLLVTG